MGTLMINMPVIGNCDEVMSPFANIHRRDLSYISTHIKYILFVTILELS
jgi:hypothetical protein